MPLTVATISNSRRSPDIINAEPFGGAFGDRIIVPGDGRGWGDSTRPGLMYCCGYQGTPTGIMNGGYGDFLRELVERFGTPMYIPYISNGWGNDADYAKMVTAVNFYTTLCGVDTNRLILVGGSMGGATMCRYARSNKSRVLALIGLETVTDLTDIHTNSRGPGGGYRDEIDASYGGAYSEATYGATNNPATIAANGGFDGIKYFGFAAEIDDICMVNTIQKMAVDIDGGKCYVFPGTDHSAGTAGMHGRWIEDWLRLDGDPWWMKKQWIVGSDTVDQFFCSGTYTAPSYPVAVRVLAVGGGGSGGGEWGSGAGGGGGGGGEVIEYTFNIYGPTQVIVGKSGMYTNFRGTGGNGETSSMGLASALGGGGGAYAYVNSPSPQPPAGGLGTGGGGGFGDNIAKGVAIGTGGDGYVGVGGTFGHGGGGGGAGNIDATSPNGGDGKQSDITGVMTYYGGGGGGCVANTFAGTGFGGLGGGGNGRKEVAYERATTNIGRPGVDWLGGGGGAMQSGGWGTIIVRRGPSIPLIPPATTTVTSLNPNSGLQSSGATVEVNGTGFNPSTQILVDLKSVQTTYVSSTKVTTTYLGTLSTAKTYSVGVIKPNEEPSNFLPFVLNVTPVSTATVTSLNPNTAPAAGGITVEVNGTNFNAGTLVLVSGTQVQTTYVSTTKVTTTYFTTYPNEGVVQVGVIKPSELPSNTLPFTVTASLPNIPMDMWAWYDGARDATFVDASAGKVNKWKDRNGVTARELYALYGTASVTRGGSQNGNKFVSFRTADGVVFNRDNAFSSTNGFTILTVACTLNKNRTTGWGSFGQNVFNHSNGNSKYAVFLTFGSGNQEDGTEMVNVWNIQSCTFNATRFTLRKDGMEVVNTPGATQGGTGAQMTGSGAGSGGIIDVDVGEMLIYERVLNSTELSQVESYLGQKWIGPPTAPSAPTLTVALAGNTIVDLTWSLGSDGRSPVTDYIIQKSPDGSTGWTTISESVSTATTYTVTGLTNDVIQYFRVAAVNVIGTSTWSNVLSATPNNPLIPTTGLLGWWDADNAVSFTYSSGTVVSQWNDKSSNGWHVTQAVVANQPNRSGTQNGKTKVVVDGVNDGLLTYPTSVPPTNNFTTFVACKRTGGSATTSVVFHVGNPGNDGYGVALRTNGGNVGILRGGIAWLASSTPDPAAACMVTLQRNSNVWSMYLNGGLTSLTGTDSVGVATSTIYLPSNAHMFGGEIYEVIMYNRVVTTPERQQIESYLSDKWGLPVVAFDPTQLAGLSGWWDANDASTFTFSSGSVVSQWRDKSGATKHLAQASVPSQPNRNGSRNGKPTVAFGNNPYLQYVGTTGLNVGSVSIFIAMSDLGTNVDAGTFVMYSGSADYNSQDSAFVSTSGTGNYIDTYRYSAQLSTITGSGATPWGVYSSIFKSDGTAASYRDGVIGTVLAAKTGTFTTATGGLLVGARWVSGAVYASAKFNGDIGEIIVYNRVVTDPERQQVEAYLKTKWGTP